MPVPKGTRIGGKPKGYKSHKRRAQEKALQEAIATGELSAARVLEEIRRCAFVDLRGFFDEVGNLKPIQALTPDQGSALASVEVVIKNAKAGDNHTDEIHKLKLWDKPRNLEMLAKHFGLLTEKLDVHAKIALSWLPPQS